MLRISRFGLGAVLLALGFALLLPGPGAAELAAWDQDRVTEIARQLPERTDQLRAALRNQPSQTIGSGDAASALRLEQNTRRLHEQSVALAKHLEEGKGHDETAKYYKGFRELWRDSLEDARRSALPEPVMDAFANVDGLFRQLAPYYDAKALE
jgi:hypothetical protein